MESIINDLILCHILIFFMKKNSLTTRINDWLNVSFSKFSFTFNNHFSTFNSNYLTCCFINKVFNTWFNNTCSKLTTNNTIKVSFVYFYLFSKTESFENIFIRLKTNCTQQSSYRQFFLTVDISIHDIVDVSSKFYPRTTEWNNTS